MLRGWRRSAAPPRGRAASSLGVEGRKNGRLWASLTAMVSPLQGCQAAPWLPWSLESSLKPSEAWYQGWFGELCFSKAGTFNMLSSPARRAARRCARTR